MTPAAWHATCIRFNYPRKPGLLGYNAGNGMGGREDVDESAERSTRPLA